MSQDNKPVRRDFKRHAKPVELTPEQRRANNRLGLAILGAGTAVYVIFSALQTGFSRDPDSVYDALKSSMADSCIPFFSPNSKNEDVGMRILGCAYMASHWPGTWLGSKLGSPKNPAL